MSSAAIRLSANVFATIGLLAAVVCSAHGQDATAPAEQEYIAVLQSESPAANKAMACKKLAVHGTDAAVPDLAKLLSDEQLASWARIALEAIPGTAADEALRTAAGSLDGQLLVGVVNSIGVRRDAGALELLSGLMQNQDALVASCAAVALGRIGNEAATAKLRESLAGAPDGVKSAVAEACVLCAERALADGNSAQAIEIYDQVRAAEVPLQRRIEATRGAILARGDDGIPLLVEQLHAGDKNYFQIALTTARELPGNKIDAALAAELPTMAPFRAPMLVATMADRPQTVVLSAIQDAAAGGPTPVRIAAISALGRVGNASCLAGLLEIAGGDDAELAPTAKEALAVLPGDSIDQDIVARVGGAKGGQYIALLELFGARRIDSLDPLLKALEHSDKTVRTAALTSLGHTVPADKLSLLIKQVTSPRVAEDAPAAQLALKTASVRMPDPEATAAELAAASSKAPVATQVVLLEILAAVGGTKSLEVVQAAARTNDPQLRDASTRLLGDWATIDAAPVLLDLAKSGPADRFKGRTLRGYIRIARQFAMESPDRVAMCRNILETATQPGDQKPAFEILERYPSIDGLKYAIELFQQPQFKDDALRSTLVVAQKTEGHNDEVLALLKEADLPKLKIEIIKAEYGAGGAQQDVTEILKQRVTDQPVILLPSPTYVASFGGDPAPEQRKQLRVEYTIDGKPAEAKFAEDRLATLHMPDASPAVDAFRRRLPRDGENRIIRACPTARRLRSDPGFIANQVCR